MCVETPIRTKSIEAFGNVKTHIPPFLSLYILTFLRGTAAVEPLVQLGGDWCFVSASLPKNPLVFAHDRRRRGSLYEVEAHAFY